MKVLICLALLLPFMASAQTKLIISSGIDSATIARVDSLIAAAPSVSMASDLEILVLPVTVVLNAQVSARGAKFLWEVISYTGVRPVITAPTLLGTTATGLSLGTYVFRLRVTDQYGMTASGLTRITIK